MPMNIQGREHWTYDELLDQAHQRGLLGIETTLLQAPTEENGNTSISHARVTIAGPDGSHRIFTGIADANPRNTNKMIALHAPRMSETRAKARALRDALNIKGASFEELGGDEAANAVQTETSRQAQPAPAQAAPQGDEAFNKALGQMWAAVKAFYGPAKEQYEAPFREYLAQYKTPDGAAVTSTKQLSVEEIRAIAKAFAASAQEGA